MARRTRLSAPGCWVYLQNAQATCTAGGWRVASGALRPPPLEEVDHGRRQRRCRKQCHTSVEGSGFLARLRAWGEAGRRVLRCPRDGASPQQRRPNPWLPQLGGWMSPRGRGFHMQRHLPWSAGEHGLCLCYQGEACPPIVSSPCYPLRPQQGVQCRTPSSCLGR